jgi:hypothetical protein
MTKDKSLRARPSALNKAGFSFQDKAKTSGNYCHYSGCSDGWQFGRDDGLKLCAFHFYYGKHPERK